MFVINTDNDNDKDDDIYMKDKVVTMFSVFFIVI